MLGDDVWMVRTGGKPVYVQNVKVGMNLSGIVGTRPVPMLVKTVIEEKWPEMITVTAGGHTASFSPGTIFFCQNGRRRADALKVGDRVRIYDDLLHIVVLDSLERLEGGFRMFDFECDGQASFLIASGFLVR